MLVIEEMQGPDPELIALLETIIGQLVSRSLRPLETGGRQIKPRLIHGD
jgi:protein-ribulosamine 3-kinase